MLHPSREFEAKELEGKISSGASFTCPFHKCCVCKQTETEGDPELRFAMCRRCPKSYHKKCLPRFSLKFNYLFFFLIRFLDIIFQFLFVKLMAWFSVQRNCF